MKSAAVGRQLSRILLPDCEISASGSQSSKSFSQGCMKFANAVFSRFITVYAEIPKTSECHNFQSRKNYDLRKKIEGKRTRIN